MSSQQRAGDAPPHRAAAASGRGGFDPPSASGAAMKLLAVPASLPRPARPAVAHGETAAARLVALELLSVRPEDRDAAFDSLIGRFRAAIGDAATERFRDLIVREFAFVGCQYAREPGNA